MSRTSPLPVTGAPKGTTDGTGGYGVADQMQHLERLKQSMTEAYMDTLQGDSSDEEGGRSSSPREVIPLNEQWPPTDYSEDAPVSLPFGPKTQVKRDEVNQQVRFPLS